MVAAMLRLIFEATFDGLSFYSLLNIFQTYLAHPWYLLPLHHSMTLFRASLEAKEGHEEGTEILYAPPQGIHNSLTDSPGQPHEIVS